MTIHFLSSWGGGGGGSVFIKTQNQIAMTLMFLITPFIYNNLFAL